MSGRRAGMDVRAVAIALVVTLLWSSSWVLIRWGLDDESLEPLTFAALRYCLAALLLCGWVLSRRRLRRNLVGVDRSSLVLIVVLGVVFYAVTQGAQFVAIDSQPAATTSVVLALTPLLVAVLSGWSIGESPSSRQVLGTLMVAGGAWAYFAGELGATAVGMVAALVGLGANVASALLGRHLNRGERITPVVLTATSMAVGAALLGVAGIAAEGVPSVSGRGWVIIGWLAVVNTALAFTLWNVSLQRLSAVESAAINNTMLIQIAMLAWIFLDETLGATEVAGILIVSAGVFLAQAGAVGRRPPVAAGRPVPDHAAKGDRR